MGLVFPAPSLGFPVFPARRPCVLLGPPACACCSWPGLAPVRPGSGFPGWASFSVSVAGSRWVGSSVAWFLAPGEGTFPGADPRTEPSLRQVTLPPVDNIWEIWYGVAHDTVETQKQLVQGVPPKEVQENATCDIDVTVQVFLVQPQHELQR